MALIQRLEKLSSPANNIYISSCCANQNANCSESRSSKTVTNTDCRVCPEKSNQPSTHNVSSHDIQTYTCTLCDKIFYCTADLNGHILALHSSAAHPCQFCEMKFRSECDLKQHTEAAHELESHPCHFCGETFDCDEDLTNHVEAKHSSDAASSSQQNL